MKITDRIFPESMRTKMEGLSVGQKISYIWTYYWIPIISVLALVLFAIYGIKSLSEFKKYEALTVVMLNGSEVEERVLDKYLDGLEDYNSADDTVVVETGLELDIYDINSQKSLTTYQVIAARFLVGDMDIFVSDKDVIATFADNNGAVDLSTVLTEEEMETYEEKLVYIEDEAGMERPFGILLDEDSPVIEAGYYSYPVVACIVSKNRAPQLALHMLLSMVGEGK